MMIDGTPPDDGLPSGTLFTDRLPPDMRYDPDTTAVVRASGLTIVCRHGDATCSICIVAAARKVLNADRSPKT